MFKLELDLSLYYDPPMADSGGGIVMTRTLDLPFAPYEGLAIWVKEIDECPEPLGFKLSEVIWDMGREVFLAKSQLSSSGLPMALIPFEIRGWIDRGWRLGSWMDSYREEIAEASDQVSSSDGPRWDDEEIDQWMTRRTTNRPADFNKLFGAMIRTLAELHNNWSVAYAMHRTKLYFDEATVKQEESAAAKRWQDARYEFQGMPIDKQIAWQERVTRKYPSLAEIVANLPSY